MPIRGAIFDCDGTILDSMPMWTSMCVALLKRYGVANAHRVFEEHESLDMDKKCYWYHNNLGIGASGEALYRELWAMVEEAYRTSVRPYEGCRAFLEELRSQGVPCVIVSSTPTQLLSRALADHGLLDFFQEVVFVGDVGRGKEHSDCYLAAARILGTPRNETWVFEDAPFGVRSAVRAGFPTVAIVNDHDGRDEAFMRTWATLVAHTYEGLSARDLEGLVPHTLRALVVAGSPEPASPRLVRRLATNADLVVAADHGVDALHAACVAPHLYCGDEDSATDAGIAWAKAAGTRFELHPVDKYDTDLGLAVMLVHAEAERRGSALRLTLTCASGGRPDHALGVWGVLAREAGACPVLAEDAFTCTVLSPQGQDCLRLRNLVGRTVSTMALAPRTIISERGMRWDLDRAELGLMDDLGISNRVTSGDASITCHAGVLAVFVIQ